LPKCQRDLVSPHPKVLKKLQRKGVNWIHLPHYYYYYYYYYYYCYYHYHHNYYHYYDLLLLLLLLLPPVLSSERALQNNKPQLYKRKSQGRKKIDRGSQMGA
jgi:hypothetical protein